MRYKLIDVEQVHEDDVQFGTCELCMLMGSLDYDVLKFEDENGKEYLISTGEWDWGDFIEYIHIDNYILFAEFIRDRDYPVEQIDKWGRSNMIDIVVGMIEDYEEDSKRMKMEDREVL